MSYLSQMAERLKSPFGGGTQKQESIQAIRLCKQITCMKNDVPRRPLKLKIEVASSVCNFVSEARDSVNRDEQPIVGRLRNISWSNCNSNRTVSSVNNSTRRFS